MILQRDNFRQTAKRYVQLIRENYNLITLKRMNIKRVLIVLVAMQSLFLNTVYAAEKVTVTDVDGVELSAYYEGVAHTLQFSSRLMAAMKLMKKPEYKTLAFQSLFLAAGTESNNRINDLGKEADSAYKRAIFETTQLWVMGKYPVCLPMDKELSASDIETAINEAAEGPFKKDSLGILTIGAMDKLSTQYPCKNP
jgi:hypothetical protein